MINLDQNVWYGLKQPASSSFVIQIGAAALPGLPFAIPSEDSLLWFFLCLCLGDSVPWLVGGCWGGQWVMVITVAHPGRRKVQIAGISLRYCWMSLFFGRSSEKVSEGPMACQLPNWVLSFFLKKNTLRNEIRRIPYDIKGFIILDDQYISLALHLGWVTWSGRVTWRLRTIFWGLFVLMSTYLLETRGYQRLSNQFNTGSWDINRGDILSDLT